MFFEPMYDNCDEVSFYIRNDFSDNIDSSNVIFNFSDFSDEETDNIKNVTHYIPRGDINSLRFYIRSYMDTRVKDKRPNTPAKLIINPIPKGYIPKV
tara:strand:- start:618 stop:908 length:291 start_codon:yes stop_codon:yes gene_type:complete